jgi:DNA polymerase (family 10)
MDNRQLASVFRDLARLLEYKGENQFKVRAYANAYLVIKDYHEELRDVVARGEDLRQIQGIGDAIALKIHELLTTGQLAFYERVAREVPEGTLSLMNLPGIGPRTAARLAAEHGITSVEELEQALRSAGPGGLPGIGAVTEASILKAIESLRSQ